MTSHGDTHTAVQIFSTSIRTPCRNNSAKVHSHLGSPRNSAEPFAFPIEMTGSQLRLEPHNAAQIGDRTVSVAHSGLSFLATALRHSRGATSRWARDSCAKADTLIASTDPLTNPGSQSVHVHT